MPRRSARPCIISGCGRATSEKYCTYHQDIVPQDKSESNRLYDVKRPSTTKRGYGQRWQNARRLYLQQHPLCVDCGKKKKAVPAVVVDHKIPHNMDMELFWNVDNWQSLCISCHNRKTRREGRAGQNGIKIKTT